jgi:hypothetical protein
MSWKTCNLFLLFVFTSSSDSKDNERHVVGFLDETAFMEVPVPS